MKLLIYIIIFISFSVNSTEFDYGFAIIKNPLLKITSEHSETGAGYFTIYNKSKDEIHLIGVETNIAKSSDIHETKIENDIVKMRKINDKITIKPNHTFEFKPMKTHIMFYDFTKQLKIQELVVINLIFEQKKAVKVYFKVEAEHQHQH